jgi:transcriptional regulator with XRE-family HTH domain
MGSIGGKLRRLRRQLGFTLDELAERTARIAKECGQESYETSGSWLGRVERGKHELTVPKFLAVSKALLQPPEKLLKEWHPDIYAVPWVGHPQPKDTVVVDGGALEDHTRGLIPNDFINQKIPEDTTLQTMKDGQFPSHFRMAILGKNDLALFPYVKPGSSVVVDTQRRKIVGRDRWSTEHDRPIYLLYTQDGYRCGWCDLDSTGLWLSIAPHSMSPYPPHRWRFKTGVNVIGTVDLIILRKRG